ncbi:MAG: HAD-IIIA family hydrolase [Candidatus Omnitrophica bacterium]|nr:HAD-IIIA family hydrolase [Candidatus Omnitrophota bacterium]
MAISQKLRQRIKNIKVLVLDVDGVLTAGDLIFDGEGRELKSFHVQDGLGIIIAKRAGIKIAIITAGNSKVVKVRADYLRIDKLYLKAYPKTIAYEQMLKDFKVKDEHVCFVGDELTDCQILKRVGLSVAVRNAVPEVKRISHFVTKRCGGDAAVREVIELILKTQGKWIKAIAQDM